MSIKINFAVGEAASKALEQTFSKDYIAQDTISNLPAVSKGYAQGEKGKSVVTRYEALLSKDAKKIGTLNNKFQAFDQSIKKSLTSNI